MLDILVWPMTPITKRPVSPPKNKQIFRAVLLAALRSRNKPITQITEINTDTSFILNILWLTLFN